MYEDGTPEPCEQEPVISQDRRRFILALAGRISDEVHDETQSGAERELLLNLVHNLTC